MKIEFDISALSSTTLSSNSASSREISSGQRTRDFLSEFQGPRRCGNVPARAGKKRQRMRKGNSGTLPRAEGKLSEASRLNYLSRGPVSLSLLRPPLEPPLPCGNEENFISSPKLVPSLSSRCFRVFRVFREVYLIG